MDVILTGVITEILPLQQGVSQSTGNPWQSQEFLIRHEEGQYPRFACLNIFGAEKIQKANLQVGETVTAHINIDARKGTRSYFNSLNCWRVERPQDASNNVGQGNVPPQGQNAVSGAESRQIPQPAFQGNPAPAPAQPVQGGNDDLPF